MSPHYVMRDTELHVHVYWSSNVKEGVSSPRSSLAPLNKLYTFNYVLWDRAPHIPAYLLYPIEQKCNWCGIIIHAKMYVNNNDFV